LTGRTLGGHLLNLEFTPSPLKGSKDEKKSPSSQQTTRVADSKHTVAIRELDFWLGEVESLLTSMDYGKDLASVQNLIKKHQLVEADIEAHRHHIRDMNNQADYLVESGQFDSSGIQKNRQSINERYERICNLAANRQAQYQFLLNEQKWIENMMFLVGGDDALDIKYTNLKEELERHEETIKIVQDAAEKLIDKYDFVVQQIAKHLNDLIDSYQIMDFREGKYW
jgi:spectrin alpha